MNRDDFDCSYSDCYDPLVSCPGGKKKNTPNTGSVKKAEPPVAKPTPHTTVQEQPTQHDYTGSIQPAEQELIQYEGTDIPEKRVNYCQDDVDDKILYLRKKWINYETPHELVMMGLKMLDNWIEKSIE